MIGQSSASAATDSAKAASDSMDAELEVALREEVTVKRALLDETRKATAAKRRKLDEMRAANGEKKFHQKQISVKRGNGMWCRVNSRSR